MASNSTSTGSPAAYDSAGVHIGETESALTGLTARLRSTFPRVSGLGRVALDFGRYANIIDLGDGRGMAISTDGIGSKALIAEMMGKYDTVGIDCIAMNVNDLICVGARPLTLVDYIAVEKVDRKVMAQIAEGLAVGAEQAGVSISGGEIAELPDMIKGIRPGSGFDLAGTAAGVIDLDSILVGQDARPGDAVIGIESSGIHSNGMTLARRVLFAQSGFKPDQYVPDLGRTVGEELLEPTLIYVKEALAMMANVPSLRALLHITGDGLMNLPRVEAPVGFHLDALPEPPALFRVIAERGKVSAADMYTVFNMGIGLAVIAAPDDVDDVIAIAGEHGKIASRIGTVTADAGTVVVTNNPLDGTSLKGNGRALTAA